MFNLSLLSVQLQLAFLSVRESGYQHVKYQCVYLQVGDDDFLDATLRCPQKLQIADSVINS